jgi:hypothetical protein
VETAGTTEDPGTTTAEEVGTTTAVPGTVAGTVALAKVLGFSSQAVQTVVLVRVMVLVSVTGTV